MSTRAIRIALVGCGKIARDQHVPAIAGSPDFDLAATVDPSGGIDAEVPHFSDLAALIDSGIALDAVAICTPPRFRSDLAERSLEAGLHVMLEKPPSICVADAERLAQMAGAKRLTAFAAWHSREAAGVEPARQWLADKAIRSVRIDWREDVRVWHPGQAWIFEDGGFGVFDPAINALSIITAILPQALQVEAAQLDIPDNCAAPIAGTVMMSDAEGVPVKLEMDFLQTGPQTWDIVVETDAGPLRLSLGGSVMTTPDGRIEAEDAEYPRLYARFCELIRAGQSEVDLAPLTLVEAALECGERRLVAPFIE